MALPEQNRIRRTRDFETIFKKGRSISGTFLFIKSVPAASGVTRFAFVVSSKVAKSAVNRNRIRRTLSAAARNLIPRLAKAWDMVVVVTKPAEVQDLKKDFIDLIGKARL
ncbi:MAG TPA: ribonuclease P protein component [Candidatus Paceibacterota bacterium]|nr:ribonuclease P protein component [Candidatus Paceibacterota bacterium]